MKHRKPQRPRLAWARLNSDGWLLVGLLLMSALDLLHPDTSNIARIVGYPPSFQPLWLAGFAVAGALMGAGFVTARTSFEVLGRALLVVCVTAQTIAVGVAIGWDNIDTVSRVIVWALVAVLSWLRVTTLLSPDGLTVTLPSRERSSGE